MLIRPGIIFAIIWIGWLLSWMIAAFWTSPTQKRVATWDVWLSRVLLLVGAALLFHSTRRLLREPMLWHVGYHGGYALAGVAFMGILFTWWARIHLGRLWSGTITLKQDHHVVDTGPYALVRHPIYTGLILSILATAAAQATFTGLLGAVADCNRSLDQSTDRGTAADDRTWRRRLRQTIADAYRCSCRFGPR